MEFAIGAAGGADEYRGNRGIGALERPKADFCRRVGMLERIDELARARSLGCSRLGGPTSEETADPLDLCIVSRRPERSARAMANQVVDQDQPAAGSNRADLVPAVGVESGVSDFRRLRRREVEADLALAVADAQLAAGVERRQDDHQGGEHPRRLLGITMADEKTAGIVDQQLVQLGRDGFADTQTGFAARDDVGQMLVPVTSAKVHTVGTDLPRPAHRGVDQGIATPAIRRLFGDGDERFGLCRQQRQRNEANAVHFQPRREDLAAAGGGEIAGAADVLEDVGKVAGKVGHGLRSCG